MLNGPKIVRMEVMVTKEMYAAVKARARRIADGDGANFHAAALRELVAEGAKGMTLDLRAEDMAEAEDLGRRLKAREDAKRARRRK